MRYFITARGVLSVQILIALVRQKGAEMCNLEIAAIAMLLDARIMTLYHVHLLSMCLL